MRHHLAVNQLSRPLSLLRQLLRWLKLVLETYAAQIKG